MRRVANTLVQLLEAGRAVEEMRHRQGGLAARGLMRRSRRLMRQGGVGAQRPSVRDGLVFAVGAGLVLALVGAGAANASVGPAVRTGVESCLPLLSGQPVAQVAKAHGLKTENGGWIVPAPGAALVDVAPPGSANPNVCQIYVKHAAGEEAQILETLDAWAAASSAALRKVKDRERAGDRLTTTWVGAREGKELVVVLSKLPGEAGSQAQSTVLVSKN